MNDLPSVSIIIPTYNGKKIIEICLASLFQRTEYPRDRVRVLVVDDGSTDGTDDYLRQKYGGKADLVSLKENVGFIRAINLGMKYCLERAPDYIVLLNNDTRIIQDDWLMKLIETAESYGDKMGLICPKLIFPNGQIQWSGRPRETRTFFLILQTITARYNPGFGAASDRGDAEEVVLEVNTVTGACMLIKSNLIKAIGMFDTALVPAFQEDVEYSFRSWRAGYKVLFRPDVRVVHNERSSYESRNSEAARNRKYWQLRNCIVVSLKYFGIMKALLFGSPIYLAAALFDVRNKNEPLGIVNLKLASSLTECFRVLFKSVHDALAIYQSEQSAR
ncbi:MAG: glycosyltransferase family 2 protein [Halobacteriota archaeon]